MRGAREVVQAKLRAAAVSVPVCIFSLAGAQYEAGIRGALCHGFDAGDSRALLS